MVSDSLRIIHEIDGRAEARAERLRTAGLRVTAPRLAVLDLLQRDSSHPTAEQLYAMLKPTHPSLSLSTVYKTLEAFARAGLCRRLTGDGATQRFDGTTHPHHHAVCRDCGRIFDVPLGVYQHAAPPPRLPGELVVRGVRVEFDVVCPTCNTKADASETTTTH